MNYLPVRYHRVYAHMAEAFARTLSLSGVDRPSRLSAARNIVDAIFSYAGRDSSVTDKYFVRVDVTEEFPFLVAPMSPYCPRGDCRTRHHTVPAA